MPGTPSPPRSLPATHSHAHLRAKPDTQCTCSCLSLLVIDDTAQGTRNRTEDTRFQNAKAPTHPSETLPPRECGAFLLRTARDAPTPIPIRREGCTILLFPAPIRLLPMRHAPATPGATGSPGDEGPVTTPPSTTRGAAIEPWRASARRRDTTYPRHAQRTGPGLRDDPRAARALSFSTASPSWSCRLPIQEKAAHPAASRPNTPAADATHTHTPGATGSPRDGGTTTTTPSTTRGVATKPRERAPEEETTTQGTHTRFYQASEATRALPGHSRSPSSPFHGRADSHPKREAHQSTAARANTPADDTTRTRDPRGDRPSKGRAHPRTPYSDHVHQTTTEPRAPAPRSSGSRRPNGRDAGSPGQPPAPDGHPAGGPHPLSAPGRSQSSKQANQTPKQAPAHETGHGRNKARQRYENWTRKRPSHPTQPVHRVFPTRPHRPTPPTRTHPARAPPPARHPPQWTASPRCTRATAHHHKNQSNAANATPGHAPGHKLFTAAANTTT